MSEFRSPLTKIIANSRDIHFDTIKETLHDDLSKYFEQKCLQQGVFSSQDEFDLHSAVGTYIIDEDPYELKGFDLSEDELATLKHHKKTLLYRDFFLAVEPVFDAKTLQELDKGLYTFEHFLKKHITLNPGEFEMWFKSLIQEYEKKNKELADELHKNLPEPTSEEERKECQEIIEEVLGSPGTKEKKGKGKIIPFPKK